MFVGAAYKTETILKTNNTCNQIILLNSSS